MNFLNFFPSVNLTNSANFWGKSPTFKYQKIEGKKKEKTTHPCLPNYDYVLFEWAHYVCNSHPTDQGNLGRPLWDQVGK